MRGFIFISIIAVLFNFGCSKQIQQKKAPPEVIVSPAEQQKVHPKTTVVGQVVAFENVELKARITGFFEKQNVNDGAFVKKGDIIFQIQKTQYEAEVLSAQGALEQAQAKLENDTINYNRQKYLASTEAVSQRAFDLAAAQLGSSKGGLKLAEANLIEAQLNLSYTNIIAPFDGKIGIPAYDPGSLLSPKSETLVNIIQLDPMLVEFSIIEQDVLNYIIGKLSDKNTSVQPNKGVLQKKITVRLIMSNGKEYPFTGGIDYFDNVIDPLTGSIIIRAVFENPSHVLIPGAYVSVILELKEPVDLLLVPQNAIQTDQLGDFVYVVGKDNTAKYTSVSVGSVYGTDISVKSGLKAGDKIVYQGLQKIRDGMKVNPKSVSLKQIADSEGESETETAKSPAIIKSNEKTLSLGKSDTKDTKIKGDITAVTAKVEGDLNKQDNAAIEKEISQGRKEIKKYNKAIQKISDEKIVRTDVKDGSLKNIDENQSNQSPANSVNNN